MTFRDIVSRKEYCATFADGRVGHSIGQGLNKATYVVSLMIWRGIAALNQYKSMAPRRAYAPDLASFARLHALILDECDGLIDASSASSLALNRPGRPDGSRWRRVQSWPKKLRHEVGRVSLTPRSACDDRQLPTRRGAQSGHPARLSTSEARPPPF